MEYSRRILNFVEIFQKDYDMVIVKSNLKITPNIILEKEFQFTRKKKTTKKMKS